MTLDRLRAAEVLALTAWKEATREWYEMGASPFQTSSVQEGTSVLVAQARVRMAARRWAEADAALTAAMVRESAA